MNQQPFYHRVTILFTATDAVSQEEFEKALKTAMKSIKPYVQKSLEIEDYEDPEPGNPMDLM